MLIPSTLQSTFRIAKSSDVRSWSYGALTAIRDASATFNDNVKGTLHDQRIFGPIRDFRCDCGKYSGEDCANMICDMCGVKVAPKSARSIRFGHVEFTTGVRHPFDSETTLNCFPVVPADLIQSTGGQRLLALYDQLIESNIHDNHDHVVDAMNGIKEWLTPVVVTLHNWNIVSSRNTLARGIALETRA